MLLVLSTGLLGQNIRFDSEVIQVTINGDFCLLTGIYKLVPDDTKIHAGITLKYPFPVGEQQPFPDNISVTNLNLGTPIEFKVSRDAIIFNIPVDPADTSSFKVQCRQPVYENSFEYILTTTKTWGKPLTSARFRISLPDTLALESISLGYDSVQVVKNVKTYYLDKYNFMPQENLNITWREADD